ncbi:DUF805 domain-containing protein [Asticcacaulis solisilvae]|uniref:DUF805 domain-containing protein n=1 Tax=Asticcacaulis solisilvae TaxID=1217274 RepID=UPI003FD763D8
MIDLSWNSRGRIGVAEYKKARWRHFAFCIIPIALFIAGGVGFTSIPVWASSALWAVGFVLLSYYRYRFFQIMVRRLHDRNLSGKIILLSPVIILVALGAIGAVAVSAATGTGMPQWLVDGSTWIWVFILPSIGFNVFLRYQLSQAGKPVPNRYGPPPGAAAAAAVF